MEQFPFKQLVSEAFTLGYLVQLVWQEPQRLTVLVISVSQPSDDTSQSANPCSPKRKQK